MSLDTSIDVSICEFQTNILPPGTIRKGTPTPATWVWGYQIGNDLRSLGLLGHSYLGPVVVATRDTPTQMTFWNKLPDANVAKVKAYATSTDQTLIWGDPLSLNTAPTTRINCNDPRPVTDPDPEPTSAGSGPGSGSACPAARPLQQQLRLPGTPVSAERARDLRCTRSCSGAIHGGEVPAVLDGGPDSWWTPNGIYGHGYYSKGGIS